VPYQFGWATPTDVVDGNTALTLAAPAEVGNAALASLALMVKPAAEEAVEVTGRAILTTQDGGTVQLPASAELGSGGGLMQFQHSPVEPVAGVRSVTLVFDAPVMVAAVAPDDPTAAIVLWMGQA